MNEPAQAVLDTIFNRRTLPYTRMKSDPIEDDVLNSILEAANWAPTHKHTEPWRFVVFTDKGRARFAQVLSQAYRESCGEKFLDRKYQKCLDRPLHVPVVIAVAMRASGQIPEFEEILAVGAAVQNLQLAARCQGIGCAWSTPAYLEHPNLRQLLALQQSDRCFGFLYLGYPLNVDAWPKSQRKPVCDKISRIVD